MQDLLYGQLQKKNEKLEIMLRERLDQMKQMEGRRENIGVSLYQHQQQLARLQTILDSAQSNYDNERTIRETIEAKVRALSEKQRDESAKLRECESQCMCERWLSVSALHLLHTLFIVIAQQWTQK